MRIFTQITIKIKILKYNKNKYYVWDKDLLDCCILENLVYLIM